jgi:hypothetical protein
MAISAVRESPFFKNLICCSFDYLPTTRDLAGESVVLPAVVEEALPRRVFGARQAEQWQGQTVRWERTLQASVCMTGAAHYGAMGKSFTAIEMLANPNRRRR